MLKKIFFLSIVLSISSFLLLQPIAGFSQAKKSGTVSGTVTNTDGDPLPGVNVTISQLHRGASTDSEGSFSLESIPRGTHIITFSMIGFKNENREVEVQPGATISLDVVLEQSTLSTEAITVTGTPYADDPLSIPADVQVLTGINKLQNQKTSLGASLERLAGVTNISTGSQVGKPVIRGLSGSRVRVLKNNAAMEYQQYGVRHPPNIDPFMSERIEVVRGASSIQYGSDALGGAINVITHHPPDAIGRQNFISGELLNEFRTNNEEYSGGLHLEGAAGGFGFTGTFMGRTAGNVTAPDVATFQETDDTEAPKFSDELKNTDFRQINGSFGMGYKGSFGGISIHYDRYDNELNFLQPNGVGLGQILINDVVQAEANAVLSDKWVLKPLFSYSRNSRESSPGGGNAIRRQQLTDDDLAIDIVRETFIGRMEASHSSIGIFSGQVGFEFKRDDQATFGPVPLVPGGDINNFAVWVFEKVDLGDLSLNLGIRGDIRRQEAISNTVLELPDFAAGETNDVLDQNFNVVTGSVGINYRLTETLSLATNLASGFRAPSFFDLHVNGVHGGIAAFQSGDPNLTSERSFNTDFSVRWRTSNYKFTATFYRNRIDDFVFLINTGEFAGQGGPPILQNVQNDARLLGGDISATGQVLPWLQLRATFEKVDGKNRDTEDELPLMPPTRTSGEAKFMKNTLGNWENFYFSVEVQHTSDKDAAGRFEPFWQFGNAPEFSDFGVASTDSYTLVDINTGIDIPVGSQTWMVQIGVQNLFDKAYRDFLDTYKGYALNPGRNVQLKVQIPFSAKF